jgi:hypothetical protein
MPNEMTSLVTELFSILLQDVWVQAFGYWSVSKLKVKGFLCGPSGPEQHEPTMRVLELSQISLAQWRSYCADQRITDEVEMLGDHCQNPQRWQFMTMNGKPLEGTLVSQWAAAMAPSTTARGANAGVWRVQLILLVHPHTHTHTHTHTYTHTHTHTHSRTRPVQRSVQLSEHFIVFRTALNSIVPVVIVLGHRVIFKVN